MPCLNETRHWNVRFQCLVSFKHFAQQMSPFEGRTVLPSPFQDASMPAIILPYREVVEQSMPTPSH